MAKLVLLIALIAIVSTAYALQCYTCPGGVNCDDVSKAEKIKCESLDNLHYRCLKKTVKDKQTNMVNTTRRCYILRNDQDKSYCDVDTNRYENVFCDVCKDDLCNSATNINVNAGTVAAVGFTVLAARLLVH